MRWLQVSASGQRGSQGYGGLCQQEGSWRSRVQSRGGHAHTATPPTRTEATPTLLPPPAHTRSHAHAHTLATPTPHHSRARHGHGHVRSQQSPAGRERRSPSDEPSSHAFGSPRPAWPFACRVFRDGARLPSCRGGPVRLCPPESRACGLTGSGARVRAGHRPSCSAAAWLPPVRPWASPWCWGPAGRLQPPRAPRAPPPCPRRSFLGHRKT